MHIIKTPLIAALLIHAYYPLAAIIENSLLAEASPFLASVQLIVGAGLLCSWLVLHRRRGGVMITEKE